MQRSDRCRGFKHIAACASRQVGKEACQTCANVGRLCISTPGAGSVPVRKQGMQSAHAVADMLQGNWSGGGHWTPAESWRQQWGKLGLIQDRKSSSQLAAGLAMYDLDGSLAAVLTCSSAC